LPVGRVSASLRLVFVGPTVLPQKMNFSSHMLRKAVCSLSDTDPVFIFLPIYPFHPPMLFVSITERSIGSVDIQASEHHSIHQGRCHWPMVKHECVDSVRPKIRADMSIGSFLITSDKDKFRHWLISYCSQLVL